jgi:hypothetical protein
LDKTDITAPISSISSKFGIERRREYDGTSTDFEESDEEGDAKCLRVLDVAILWIPGRKEACAANPLANENTIAGIIIANSLRTVREDEWWRLGKSMET